MFESNEHLLFENGVTVENCSFGSVVWVRTGSSIMHSILRNNVFVGFCCKISNCIIGNNVQIASDAIIGQTGADVTVIEDNVWIGARAIIHPGVKISKNSVIGAGSYVTHDIEGDSISFGRPASKYRVRVFYNDGPPNIKNILKIKKMRTYKEFTHPETWKIGKHRYIEADICYGENGSIGERLIAIGKHDGPSPQGGIKFGNSVSIKNDCIIEGAGGVEIGDNTILGNNILILSSTHDLSFSSLPWIPAKIVIGDNVIIEDNSMIIGPSIIGHSVIIKENSVIIGNIDQGTINSGIFKEVI